MFGIASPCYDLLGLTAIGTLVAQISPNALTTMALQGPTIEENVWTHIVLIFGLQYGFHLWIIPPYYVTLSNINPGTGISVTTCSANSLPIGTSAYSGAIDDFRLYQRELDRDEICVLSGI